MRKTFELEDLDCANCAAKMEEAIKKLPGVKRVSVNFMTQKMILDAEDSQFDEVLKAAVSALQGRARLQSSPVSTQKVKDVV